jgi:diguanylate cyclase (GGDEF)-like protein
MVVQASHWEVALGRRARGIGTLFRRPHDLVGRTRWLFAMGAAASLVLTLSQVLAGSTGVARSVVAGCGALLAVSWAIRYRRRDASVTGDLVDVIGMLGFAVAAPNPSAALGIAFPAVWFRSVYGSSTVRVLLYCVGLMAALVASLLVRTSIGASVPFASQMAVLGIAPAALITTLVARDLAVTLFARERSQRRDAALAQLGADLLGAGHHDVIYARAWEAVSSICSATPGLCALGLLERAGRLEVVLQAGPLVNVPSVLPLMALPEAPTVGSPGATVQTLSVAPAVAWSAFPIPDQADRWLLVGAPRGVPQDVVVALWSLLTSVTLAIRTVDAHRSLAEQARTDPLTGLPNRVAFFTALEDSIRDHRRRPVVLFLDLDDFKMVNDRLGHAAGDELLRHVGERVRRAAQPDALCARLGGDEFAVLLPDDVGAEALAEGLVGLVAAPVDLAGRHAAVGVSIGLAHLAADSAEELVHRADVAMYAAKARGKNRVQVFEAGLLPTP